MKNLKENSIEQLKELKTKIQKEISRRSNPPKSILKKLRSLHNATYDSSIKIRLEAMVDVTVNLYRNGSTSVCRFVDLAEPQEVKDWIRKQKDLKQAVEKYKKANDNYKNFLSATAKKYNVSKEQLETDMLCMYRI